MATAGLSLANPYSDIFSAGSTSAPADPFAQNVAAIQRAGMAAMPPRQIQAPAAPQPAGVLYNLDTKEFFVNGMTFAEDDDAKILQATQLLDRPSVGRPQGGNWVDIDRDSFGQIADKIRNPSMGRLFAKNFGIGVDQLQQLAGYGLQLAGAEQLGGRIVAQQEEDLAKSAPYQRQFTDVKSASDFGDWFVAALGQQGPNLLESVAVGLAGFAAGTATAGPGVGAVATIGTLLAKKEFKDKVMDQAKRYAAERAKGLTPNIAKDANYAALKQAAGITGAVVASGVSNYATGAADVYGAMRDQGVQPEDFAARMQALGAGLPYAAAETFSDFVIGSRLLKGFTGAALPADAGMVRRGANLLRRGGAGAVIGGGAEGLTEVAQEGIVRGASGQDLLSDSAIKDYINSFAAGAAVGGSLGGLANLRRGKEAGATGKTGDQPTNLLDKSGSATAAPPPPLAGPPERLVGPEAPIQGRLQLEGGMGIVGPSPIGPMTQRPTTFPAVTGQGVLDIGTAEQPMTPEEIDRRQTGVPAVGQEPQQLNLFDMAGVTQQPVAQQLPFQFAPEAPTGIQFTEQQPVANPIMQQRMQAAQRRQEAEQAAAQRREAEARIAENQRQLQIAEQARLAEQQAALPQPPTPMPMVPVQPRAPQQLPLFTPRQAPVPSRAEGLRRGVGTQIPAMAPVQPEPTGRAPRQLPLITQEDQPSVAALKSAGTRTTVAAGEPKTRAAKTPGARGLKRGAKVAEVNKMPTQGTYAFADGAVYEGTLVDGEPSGEGTLTFPNGDTLTGQFSPDGSVQDGQVSYTYADGSTYVGGYSNGAFNGQGVFTNDDGTVTEGTFKDGAYVEPEPPKPTKLKKEKQDAPKERKLKQGREQQRQQDNAGVRQGRETGQQPKTQVQTGGTQAGGGGKPVVRRQEPQGLVVAENIAPEAPRKTMAELEAEAAAQRPVRTVLSTERGISGLELVNEEFAAAVETDNILTFTEAITTVINYAYFNNESTTDAPAVLRARELLANTSFSESQQGAIDGLVIKGANTQQVIEGAYTRDVPKRNLSIGDTKPWFDYASARGLLPSINTVIKGLPFDTVVRLLESNQLRMANLPADTVKKYKAANPQAGTTGNAGVDISNTSSNAGVTLAEEIKLINTFTGVPYSPTKRKNTIKKLRDMWAAAQAAEMEDFITESGVPLSSYFTVDGEPNTGMIGGQFRVTNEEFTPEVQAKREEAIADAMALEDDEYESPFSLDDWNARNPDNDFDGRYFKDDGTPIKAPVPMGRVKMLVSNFLSKLGIKPKVSIYRNQADFKAKNPTLYARAAAARPQGDFDTASAVGYSFGDGNVVIFSDRVATEQQLNFVLAHETLGHFGFRGLLSAGELNAALDAVYNASAKVKNAVDTIVQVTGMSRREATEEYLADFAGMLDTNILAQFWNAIKNALNKIGVRFDDDTARYLVSQSRRYVRNGTTSGTFVDFKALANRMSSIEGMNDPDGSGRFALADDSYSETNRIAALKAFGHRSVDLASISNLFQEVKDRKINLKDTVDRVLGELKTMNYLARENRGYRTLYSIFKDTSKTAAQLREQYNKLMNTVLSPAAEFLGYTGTGATKEQIDTASTMLRAANSAKLSKVTEAELRKLGPLVKIANGVPTIDTAVFEKLNQLGRMTLDDFKNGFEWTQTDWVEATSEYRQGLEKKRDAELAAAKDDAERKTITKQYQRMIEDPSMEVQVKRSFDAMPNITKDSLEWVMYNEVRDAMNKSATDMLLANFAVGLEARVNVERKTEQFLTRTLTENDRQFLGVVMDKYMSLYMEGSKIAASGETKFDKQAQNNAEEFVKAFNQALLGESTDRNAKVQEFFDQAQADDIANGIEALKRDSTIQRNDPDLKFAVQQAIANITMTEESRGGAENFAKQSIAGGYVPFGREGTWQVRVQAIDPKTGRIYKVADEYRERLFFAQTANKADALHISENVQEVFDSVENDFRMKVLVGNEYKIRSVKLVAQPETARQTVSTTAEANLNEVIGILTRFSVDITPEERARLTVGLTRQNAAARNRLRRGGAPGEDPNTIKYVSQHLEATASTVARKQNRHRLDRLFDESDRDHKGLWYGDEQEYKRLKAAWEAAQQDPNMSEPMRFAAKQAYIDYHYTYVTKNSKQMGNRYLDRGRRAVAFIEEQANVDQADFGSGEAGSVVRTATTFAFMGASLATSFLNYVSLATNVMPTFSGYNEKNGFGGGFGWNRSAVEVTRAIGNTKNNAQSTVKYWDDLLADPAKLKASGFTEAEAQFMQKEVGGGTMQAALTNSLLGSARGKFTSGLAKQFGEKWMSLFNYTEQHSRRATGLAAFRLSYARAMAEGKDAATAFEVADKFAVDMIDNTLGEYAMFNRPAIFRGGLLQFAFMFKMFVVNSVQMLASLSKKDQLLALGILLLFTGLKGMPFGDDLMDLIDTIAQTLGWGPGRVWKGSAERTLTEALDAIAPGLTPLLLRGVLNTFTPANVSDRVSLSNIIPGTGIALAGADIGRELIEIAGPVASFLQGALVTSADMAKWGLGTVGLINDTTPFNKVLRESPVTMARALGDMMSYQDAGAIVNRKGYVVSRDLHLGTMLTRALGFYPAAATAENDVVRVARRIGDYQKEVVATYRSLYVSAKIAKDEARAREVLEMVREWNDAARGTGMEIRTPEASFNKALREAQRTASERFLRAAPRAMRPETQRIMEMYGVTD